MVSIYINGKRITKEEIKHIEIHSEAVKRILAEKLTKKNK